MISIIIPVYNAEKEIEKTLTSILGQVQNNIEVLCINDGSKDNSLKILEGYAQKDKRLHVYSQKNLGVSAARNYGIEKSQGKYLLFVDADDCLSKNSIAKLTERIQTHEMDLYVFGANYFCDDKIVRTLRPEKEVAYTGSEILKRELEIIETEYFNAVWNKLYKASVIKKYQIQFNENLTFGEDSCFNLLFLTKAKTYLEIPECFYQYCLDSESSITRKFDMLKLEKLIKYYEYRTFLLKKNKQLKKHILEIESRKTAIRICFSAFSDLFQPQCQLSRREKLKYISSGIEKINVEFKLKDNHYLSLGKKVLNTCFCFRLTRSIYAGAYLLFLIKKDKRNGSMYY